MISAKDARSLLNDNERKYIINRLEEIENDIKNRSLFGYLTTTVRVYPKYKIPVSLVLKEAGYEITEIDDDLVHISWS